MTTIQHPPDPVAAPVQGTGHRSFAMSRPELPVSAGDERRLDNPVYAALTGAQSRFAQARGRALRYQPQVAPFLALPLIPSAEDWANAASLCSPRSIVTVVHTLGVKPPAPWQTLREYAAVQMVGERVSGSPDPEAVALGPADVDEILELVGETKPGPFLERTIELGRYLGIRRDGRLVAMAGERIHFEGWREVSGVCTRASHRGQGLASRLVAAIVEGIERRSETAFLHVLATNTSAIRLYEQLGFRVRGEVVVSALTPGRDEGVADAGPPRPW